MSRLTFQNCSTLSMNDNPILAAYADDVLNTCSFCKHCQYIADHRMHYCMLHKKDIFPEQEQCKDHE